MKHTTLKKSASAEHKLEEHYFQTGYNYALSNIKYIIESMEVYNYTAQETLDTIYNLKEKTDGKLGK